ncbi:MAG: glycosyltransferase family 2 protein [Lachnospiraceae bacterium]|nr:glycosyltransferase family 2 protein [Lachnospiraceae bacterium]
MRILIIIPCYNEEKNIERVVNNLQKNFPQYDYLIVNDCSTDTTKEICKEKQYNYVSLCTNLGIGGGVQTGYIYAAEKGYDVTVQVDGDGQHDPAYIEKLIDVMQANEADMVIGSRFIQNQGFQTSASRRLGIRIINAVIGLCSGVKITDSTSGFRACSKRMTEFFAKNYAQDYPEPEAIVAATLHGYKVMECPVEMRAREGGTSSINLVRSIYYMIKVTCAIILQRFAR